MTCRDELYTCVSGGPAMRFQYIGARWEYLCELKFNQWADAYNRRVDEMIAQRAFHLKINKWKAEMRALAAELRALMQEFNVSDDMGPADWDAVAAGREHKVQALLSNAFPRETWPRGVPYPNLIAKYLHEQDEQQLRVAYMKRYAGLVQEIAKRGAETMALKRIAGDTTDGVSWEKPMTAEQIQHWRELLRAERESEAKWAKLEADIHQRIIVLLQGPAQGEQWDVPTWAINLLQTSGLTVSCEAKVRVFEIIGHIIERCRLDNGYDARCAYGIDVGSDQVSVGDEHELESDDEDTFDYDAFDQNINGEDDFFLPYDV
ncbi:hypothetical protein C7974DRAFT_472165 [Boeremia exigua]|uniref:uncharacterized protein n=1 Tax=Boeremia exigua TaxID=749465 RepID=UPI001E8DA45A|nr:uncharacterized protein C7974DRAFT_472165 [Boeremia exigua]KAH6629352.1 hypothetical protein C7974DRAFT_472165 [Boeremia exigua]